MRDAVIIQGDCLEVMASMPDSSVDAIVTDPPAGIAFMGKVWDQDKGGRDHWIAWMAGVAREALRVAKPGAHALVWALPRTSHWTATAWEDAGWEIRDRVAHVFGSGFPKSLDIGKATDAAEQWDGWGTALKPAMEDWWLLRKPLAKGRTIAANVLEFGTGGLNIEGCKVEAPDGVPLFDNGVDRERTRSSYDTGGSNRTGQTTTAGRWPSNLVHDNSDEVREVFPETTGRNPQGRKINTKTAQGTNISKNFYGGFTESQTVGYMDHGSAARYFKSCPDDDAEDEQARRVIYCAKASKRDREEGLEGMEARLHQSGMGGAMPVDDDGKARDRFTAISRNHHPTVKSAKLMQYLTRLITPPGGTILDPFAGSGSTGKAAVIEGFGFVGIEQDAEYCEIARARIAAARSRQLGLFEVSSCTD